MWDSNSPLQLLSNMPRKLTKENLEKLQLVIDADKYKNSLLSGFDLCGMYAPFCRDCKKTSIYPCAIAYINMMKSGGMDIEIDAKPVTAGEPFVPPVYDEPEVKAGTPETKAEAPEAKEEVYETKAGDVEEEVAAAEEVAEFEEEIPEPVQAEEVVEEPQQPKNEPLKRKIRIAVARRKYNP